METHSPHGRRRPRRTAAAVGAAIAGAATALTLVVAGVGADGTVADAAGTRLGALASGTTMSLTIPGIPGSGSSLAPTDIQVYGYTMGEAVRAGRAHFTELDVDAAIDKSSPLLLTATAGQVRFPTVTLRIGPPAGTKGDSEVITLDGVGLRAKTDCCSAGAGYTNLFVYNRLAFTFSKITVDYTDTATGRVTHGGWNLATNKKL
jgi:type VI protein secretion system component Hcp